MDSIEVLEHNYKCQLLLYEQLNQKLKKRIEELQNALIMCQYEKKILQSENYQLIAAINLRDIEIKKLKRVGSLKDENLDAIKELKQENWISTQKSKKRSKTKDFVNSSSKVDIQADTEDIQEEVKNENSNKQSNIYKGFSKYKTVGGSAFNEIINEETEDDISVKQNMSKKPNSKENLSKKANSKDNTIKNHISRDQDIKKSYSDLNVNEINRGLQKKAEDELRKSKTIESNHDNKNIKSSSYSINNFSTNLDIVNSNSLENADMLLKGVRS